jgi:A/G-specific adenine glycosylase
MPSFFAKQVLQWHATNPRPLPWDGGPRDPYHIWISEIIMQQTRIEQGAAYYLRFVNLFPSVRALADAHPDEVIRAWQGLGYYSRARNIHKAATHIVHELNGVFPTTYDGLLKLPGVGPYSAAAIASFAYALPYPVVDGNVKRVIARFAGITSSIDEAVTHKEIESVASSFMGKEPPGIFNQAIMNFGALVCKPANPDCTACPLSGKCFALRNDLVGQLPARTKKKSNTIRHFHFIVLHWRGKFLLERRSGKDIWQGLYAPPVMERNSERTPTGRLLNSFVTGLVGHTGFDKTHSSPALQQVLSHQTIVGRFHHIHLLAPPHKLSGEHVWVTGKTFQAYGKPKMVAEMNLKPTPKKRS